MYPQYIINKINNHESFLLASDGQYLGKLSLNRYDAESISNVYGIYGNRYSATSIFNPYSIYGSQYSSLSPNNPYTSTPPIIFFRGRRLGFLTKNRFLGTNNIDSGNLFNWIVSKSLNF